MRGQSLAGAAAPHQAAHLARRHRPRHAAQDVRRTVADVEAGDGERLTDLVFIVVTSPTSDDESDG